MQKILLFISLTSIFLVGCSGSKQYGVDILKLDNFDFKLNIETFFKDETIFRGTNKKFNVSSDEYYIDEDSVKMGYIYYSTRSMSTSHPLASYAGVKFESLGIVTDSVDEKVLMAIGSSSHTNAEDIKKIIDKLLSINGTPEIKTDKWGDGGMNLLFQDGDKVLNLFLNVSMSRSRKEENFISEDQEKNKDIFTTKDYEALKDKIKDLKEIECKLFVTKSYFDKALNEASDFSGDLTRYKQ